MTHYAFVPSDKTIVKDGFGYIIPSDDTWLNDYSSIHAIQIYDSSGEVETVSGENRSATAEEIKAVKDKWTALKAVDDKANDDYNNSWDRVRTDRSFWLADTDWTVMPDSALTSEKQEEFKKYRSDLRNLPQTYSSNNPKDITIQDGNVSVSGSQKITKPSL